MTAHVIPHVCSHSKLLITKGNDCEVSLLYELSYASSGFHIMKTLCRKRHIVNGCHLCVAARGSATN